MVKQIMKKKITLCFSAIILFFLQAVPTFAQVDTSKPKIAIFAPLYLDSAFDAAGTYRYDKAFPKFINPGLEFYEGAQLAFDSLNKEGRKIDVYVYDTRSATSSLSQQIASPEMSNVEMIIGYTTGPETHYLADIAKEKKIPFINVNLPNDGGVSNNPYFVMLNSGLRTHCEGVYKYVQKYYPLDPVIVFRRKGQLEDILKKYLDEYSKSTAAIPLKIKYVDLVDSFTVNQLKAQLDSNRHYVCIAGSLDENFGRRLTLQLASVCKHYPLTAVGMPTWDGIKDFTKPEYKGLEIVYGTPFYNPRTDKVSESISDYFSDEMYARPSDMVMRGYETAWRFTNLLLKYKSDIASNLSRKEFNVFREFDIEPVFLNTQNMTLDYFENKKIYFLKWQDGLIKAVQ